MMVWAHDGEGRNSKGERCLIWTRIHRRAYCSQPYSEITKYLTCLPTSKGGEIREIGDRDHVS
jgi:hypothetical protein